ncbi:lamin tail domain-containing protein [Candidatus Saccharibacteria bacterium]|nr:lamin tail domain-containing protein [Candidatus Saccharibacteria bacterium]
MATASAQVAVPPLVIREMKITDDEFVVLQATTDIPDLSAYWIGYTGSDTVNPGSLVPSQQLPAYSLHPGQAVLMTSDGAEVCDAVLTTKLSVGLSDTKGTFVVRSLESSGITSTFITVDSVNWAKPSTSGTTTAALDLRKQSSLTYPVWYHAPSFEQSWQVGNLADCTLALLPDSSGQTQSVEWVKNAVEPPAIIEDGVVLAGTTDAIDPNANIGLAPPLITELLPNPTGTGNDGSDEFIELYNSNDAAFDLSGFTLRTGLSTTHDWTVPTGTILAAKSFRTFYSRDTGLSMSNTEGQVQLLDLNGAVVAKTSPYDSAPDGEAWALANGTWYWTTKPTPGATNVIAKPIAKPASATKKLTTKKAVKSASTKKAAKAKKTAASTANDTTGSTLPAAARAALHPVVLATVAIAAIGYGLYEYRHDLANAVHRLRKH